MWVLIREASNARNLRALLAMVREHGPELLRVLHRRPRARLPATARATSTRCAGAPSRTGSRAEDVLVMASLHGARAHGLLDRGAIAPGYSPTSCCSTTWSRFGVVAVLKDGASSPSIPAARRRPTLRDTMRSVPVAFGIPATPEPGARDRHRAGAADHRRGRGRAADRGRRRRRRPGARPGQDRRDRAPSRRRAASGSGWCAGSGCARARSRRPSPTTRTTSSWWASTTLTWRCAPRARRRSAAGWWWRATARCAASSRSRSPGCCPTAPLEEVAEGLEHLQDLLPSRAWRSARRS